MPLVQILTLLGVAVFAASGALAAGRRSLDPIGVLVLRWLPPPAAARCAMC